MQCSNQYTLPIADVNPCVAAKAEISMPKRRTKSSQRQARTYLLVESVDLGSKPLKCFPRALDVQRLLLIGAEDGGEELGTKASFLCSVEFSR